MRKTIATFPLNNLKYYLHLVRQQHHSNLPQKFLIATYDIEYNPNGSYFAVEGITSIDGRIFGKMGHSERIGQHVMKNIIGEKDQKIFESGVNYFK